MSIPRGRIQELQVSAPLHFLAAAGASRWESLVCLPWLVHLSKGSCSGQASPCSVFFCNPATALAGWWSGGWRGGGRGQEEFSHLTAKSSSSAGLYHPVLLLPIRKMGTRQGLEWSLSLPQVRSGSSQVCYRESSGLFCNGCSSLSSARHKREFCCVVL